MRMPRLPAASESAMDLNRTIVRPSVTARRALLDVLGLLAQALELRLALDDEAGDAGVLSLRPDGVELAPHLLDDEVELAPHGARRPHELTQVPEVRLEPNELLADVEPLGHERRLLSDAARLEARLFAQAAEPLLDAPREPLG